MTSAPPFERAVAGWLLLSATLSAAGWLLSTIRFLNHYGYCLIVLLGLVGFWLWRRHWASLPATHWRFRRFRRLFPALFLLLAVLTIAGGLIHVPNNGDALAYRTPRVLHWLAEGRWHWIHTGLGRMNTRATGFEWLSAPMILFGQTDRWLFLINAFSFLLLPGLVFSVFVKLGVRRAVAWHWMWLLPSGYCFALQAGSISNDAFGVIYVLAAMQYALRARASRNPSDVWLSLLAAALATGAKASNLALLLPWAIAIVPALPSVFSRPFATAAVVGWAALSSCLPMAILNARYTHDWTGTVIEWPNWKEGKASVFFAGNALNLAVQNFAPPLFPVSAQWNASAYKLLPRSLHERMKQQFENAGAHLRLNEMVSEEGAGIGLGLSVLLVASMVAAWRKRSAAPPRLRAGFWNVFLRWSPFLALVVFMMKSGASTVARLITPFYPLTIAAVLTLHGTEVVIRARWWRVLAVGGYIFCLVIVILTPARPLWPGRAVFDYLAKTKPGNLLVARGQAVYSVYADRWDAMAPVRALLPSDARIIGLVFFGDCMETSLWRPFFVRRFEHVLPDDPPSYPRQRGLTHLVVGVSDPRNVPDGLTLEQWLRPWLEKMDGEVTGQVTLTVRARASPVTWYTVKLRT